ncbi:SusC/RagA family TonB-linked outer membrane protein [Prevotella sp. E2-28]|jgi:TonB-linked SusC/RagA family outer membrane protein|uniref:SusC/RagA family TonB-linked outer membrane protein n=1 Tax=Prevotella sp. E2-28 TaxID=2913620 RepID=UPI001EDBC32B|nr:SusC/RagA family TonB-linked outer membrane protein [Prevotella sp. E2-28]UKK53785.1 SusC/RagA family TonB-linked outer membrane protein [Prevotella sp. E2-28]
MKILKSVLMTLALLLSTSLSAQNITSVHGTLSDDMGELMGATVCEIDATGRIIESAITDMNGNFTMKVRNPKDKIRFSYVGLKTVTLPINKTTYVLKLQSATKLKEVTVTSKRRAQGNSLPIPQRELSYSTQTISMKEFEGLGITSVDEALQGRIAGLDIVGNSGDLGKGSTMRLRGASSISSLTDSNPLIVVDGNIREVNMDGFDMAGANDEKFAELLNINPEDIADIRVLKDAAATAVYGSQGGNGVIELTTKRGARGKPKVTYSLKLTGTYQPKGYDLLTGDDYTMMLKEAYFNPRQDDNASNMATIPEINYPTATDGFADWRQYRDNTDWRDAVTQWGLRQNHYATITGGGEKASFRIGAGYDHETGTMIENKMDRFSTRVNLDYNVSQRIRVQTNFALTYSKYDDIDDLLSVALKKMPNMSIYQKDPVTGEDTDMYYNMPQSGEYIGSEVFKNDQRTYVNPVASAHLKKSQRRVYDMNPELIINYDLLGLDDEHTRLTWRGSVYMNISNHYTDKFDPQELYSKRWEDQVNKATASSSKSVSFNTKQTLTLIPAFANKDHAVMMMGRFELTSGSSSSQSTDGYGLPTTNGVIDSPSAGGLIGNMSSGYSQWRSMYYTFSSHYAYKGRYIADFTLRVDGTTKFGPGNRWGYFPSVSLKWIISDEPWMQKLKPTLSMLAIRPSWGRVGNQPNQNYLFTSKYGSADKYIDMSAMKPLNIRLTDLKWQLVSSYNFGIDLGFMDNRLNLTIEGYQSTTSDMLMGGFRIPSNAGFTTVPYHNNGKMRNTGWEFHINTNRMIKAGKFTMDMNANFGNNRNEILEMDPYILENKNSVYGYNNGETLRRVQLHNPFGAIYGFKYKGVYQYNYNTVKNAVEGMTKDEIYAWWKEFTAAGKTAPVAVNADGNIVLEGNNVPKRMMYDYRSDNTGHDGSFPGFNGGDAIYEDLNHDGQINALDITYLGSSLPKLTGGFGFSFNYGAWRLSTQFTYRVGNKIINKARLNAEAMTSNDNQSQAVNYRWRQEGDITPIPRAMFGGNSNYNTLISDRFVEDGSYLRMSYAQLNYAINKKHLTWIGLNRLSFYASVNNPFVITKYSGVDPDIAFGGEDPAIDNAQTPRSRSYTLGITVDF